MTKPILPALTGSRFVAAAAVLMFHFAGITALPPWAWVVLPHGRAGVSFFFVLSGFILTFNYRDWFATGVSRGRLISFARARFARIVPMHVAALCLITPIIVTGMYAISGGHPSCGSTLWAGVTWLANLLLIQVYLPTEAFEHSWNIPSWSICCEAFFYAAFPFAIASLLSRLKSARRVIAFAGVCYLVECGYFAIVMGVTWARHAVDSNLYGFLAYQMPFARVWEFLIGCCAAVLFLDYPPRIFQSRSSRNAVVIGCFLAVAGVVVLGALPLPGVRYLPDYVAYTPIFAVLVPCLASGPTFLSRALESRPAMLLGEASYSLYLIHWTAIVSLFHARSDVLDKYPLWLSLSVMAACVLASLACLKYIEAPARRLLRQAPAPRPAEPVASDLARLGTPGQPAVASVR